MKYVKIYLFMGFLLSLIPGVLSMEENKDPELTMVLETMMNKLQYLQNRRFPDLPTEADVERLEAALFAPGHKLPIPLKEYHLICGNRIFGGGVDFPTIHQREIDGHYRCHLLDFIREGHDKGVPLNWLAFAEDGSAYVCMELQTEKVCYFSFVPRFKKDKKEYANFSSWIKERLLSNELFWKG